MTEPSNDNGGSAAGASVRLPPPVLYAAPFLAGWALDRVAPLRMADSAWRKPTGVALVAAGEALAGWGVLTFRRHGTTIIPHHRVRTMVTSGPYAVTRNPMYVGLTTSYLGASLLLGSWWPPLALPAVVLAVDRLVIAREEAYLRGRFGEAYEEFCRRSRRWL
jgi:protein-S-isoprenylcysteine O-methyltransferase Ste14